MTRYKSPQQNATQSQIAAGAFWKSIINHNKRPQLSINELVAKYTAAKTLEELCGLGTKEGYRPSIYTKGNPEKARLADAYDAFQKARGDARRAYRS